MPLEWAGSSPDLLLVIDRESHEPLRSQVERGLREAIRAGRLCGGERLPSSRALAHGLGLSRGLVQECYAQLQAEGYLVPRVGSGTRVAVHTPVPQPPAERPARLVLEFGNVSEDALTAGVAAVGDLLGGDGRGPHGRHVGRV
jgi:GntR family transcriptional regulator/MocR family aminotransferase